MINIDTFIISLKYREDRRLGALNQLAKIKLNPDRVQFQDAKYTLRNGAIGCAMSQAYALSRFLFESNAEYCLIFEDDFEVLNPDNFSDTLANFLSSNNDWDVLMLASNVAVPISAPKHPNVFRVVHAQTASAYLVKRHYAPTLVKTFYEAADYLSSRYLTMDTKTQNYFYAIDMIWKPLQLEANFYAFLPQLVRQRESYSDIENKLVSYGV
ncbi:MAG: glycosyltransferase family 25 protein [Polynucleobacter sp.]|nr:glycosyltransferase family 25 protein [Polynucleobacter sp.]